MPAKLEIRFRKGDLLPLLQYLLLFILVFLAVLTQISDPGIWWHLAAGRYIVHERALIARDVFSFTAPELPLRYAEWLFGVAAHLVTAALGVGALVVMKSLLAALTLFILLRLARARGAGRLVSIAIVLWALFAVKPALEVGPEIVGYLLLAILLSWLHDYAAGRSRALCAAPLLVLAWALLGRGVSAGLMVIGIYLAGDLASRLAARFGASAGRRTLSPRALLILAAVLLLSAAAAWITGALPPSAAAGAASVAAPGSAGPLPPLQHPAYGLMLLAAAAVLFVNLTVMPVTESLLLLVPGLLSLRSAAAVPVFALCAAPVLASQAADALAQLPERLAPLYRAARRWTDIGLLVLPGALIVLAVRNPALGVSPRPLSVPAAVVEFIEKNGPQGRIFNGAREGDYLAWRLFPSYRVFIDGRGRESYPAVSWRDFSAIASGSEEGKGICNTLDVNTMIVPARAGFVGLIDRLRYDPEWRLAYWDILSFVYVRDIPANRGLIHNFRYQTFDPEEEQVKYWVPPIHLQAAAEISRYLKDHPGAVAPRSLLAMREFKAGRLPQAAREYEALLEINPRLATVHHNLALIAASLGDEKRAEDEYLKEIGINPAFPPALNNLGRIYLGRREIEKAEEMFRKALEIDPNYVHARSNLGYVFMEKGAFDDAAGAFEAVLKAVPHDRAAFHNLRLARQLARQKEAPRPAGGRVYGPLTREESERLYGAAPGEGR